MGSKFIALIICLPLILLFIAFILAIFYLLRSRKRIRQHRTTTPIHNQLPRTQPIPNSNSATTQPSSQPPYPISPSQGGMPTPAAAASVTNLDQPPPYPESSELPMAPPAPPPYYSKLSNS
ncbi:hypothetical protein KSF78_0009277 [Schistosoma japonicum]|nr:hypothetical protein KSF78_0009277 [Schistosoma japonicum]